MNKGDKDSCPQGTYILIRQDSLFVVVFVVLAVVNLS